MSERLLGIETEYGLAASANGTRPRDYESCAEDLLRLATKRYPFIPSLNGTGMFLTNGARFYIDSGQHPEFCTPEVNNPWDVVRYIHAGDEFLHRLANELATRRNGTETILFKCNVDYRTGATWACHENYGHHANPQHLPNQIIPHLVSRIIYTGAGGLNPFSNAIEFCLSPRVHHLEHITSPSSTNARGIYHLKDETLSSSGWHRLHILCGESLCSQLGAWLKAGTTALVVALVEAGLRPGEAVQFRDPLDAMRCFNADPLCRSSAKLMDDRLVTALDVQRHYLAFVEQHRGDPCLPAWAPQVCEAWRDILNRLERGPAAVATRLDCAMKRTLYLDHIEHRGFKPEEIATFNRASAVPSRPPPPLRRDSLLAMLAEHRVVAPEPPKPAPPPKCTGLSEAQCRELSKVRLELCELDVRFGQLGPKGIFAALDRAGLLQHRLPEISPQSVSDAVSEPPPSGRARVRGQMVKLFAGRPGYLCDWSGVMSGDGEVLDLSNPLQQEMPEWKRGQIHWPAQRPPAPTDVLV